MLDKTLATFFANAKKKDGTRYKANALLSLRQGLRRHYLDTFGFDIVNDESFSYSSKVFKAAVKYLRRQGVGSVKHHIPITRADMPKLYSGDTVVFYTDTPNGLLNKVWFEVMYFLCRRGQENLRAMTKETFELSTDSTGKRYIYQNGGMNSTKIIEIPRQGLSHKAECTNYKVCAGVNAIYLYLRLKE